VIALHLVGRLHRIALVSVLVLLLWSTVLSPMALADTQSPGANPTVQSTANQQVDDLPLQSINQFWSKLENEYSGYLPDITGPSIVRSLLGNGGPSWQSFFHGLVRYFFGEILDNAQLLGSILILAVLAAMLESMQSAFEHQTVSQVAYAMIFLVMMVLAISSFTEAIGYARHAIQSMNDFMLATIPLSISLLVASGAFASAAFFSPVLLFGVHLISNIVFLVVFPLIFFGAVLDITSALSPRYQLTRLASLLRNVGLGLLGVSLSIFLGIASVQGAGKGIADGVTLRAAKAAVDLVPVVGKAFSDAAEIIASASVLVKNAVGITALITVAVIALFPCLKIIAISLVYSGSSAFMQPLGDNPMIQCLSALGKSLIYVFACVAAVALMFFVSIVILLVAANLTAVMV